jgi:glycosyltransferase involved in cell wall biosynthesis
MSEAVRPPRVFIGMPTFNRADLVVASVSLVLNQTYADFELLICDDGSSDDTLEQLKGISDARVTVMSFANRGPPHPLNEILKRARGDYLIILHDHDIFSPDLIARSVQALDAHPEAHFVVQGSAWVAEDGTSHYRPNRLELEEINSGPVFAQKILRASRNLSFPLHACCMIRRASFEQAGYCYRTKAGWYADIDLSFRLLNLGSFAAIGQELFRFRTRNAGHMLTNDFRLTYNTLFEIFEEHTAIFFARDASEKEMRLLLLRDERRRFLSRALQHALAYGELARFRAALTVACQDMPAGFTRLVILAFGKFPASHLILCRAAHAVFRLRQKLRGSSPARA